MYFILASQQETGARTNWGCINLCQPPLTGESLGEADGAARRTGITSRWICQSCRRSIKTDIQNKSKHPSGYTDFSQAAQKLRDGGPARTRFAPSPTGYLHLGSLRTALFNYLVAKATGGQFLLRIEDTDQRRTIPDAEERLYEDLEWAGIEWDEGPRIGGPKGPYKQSERTAIYRQGAETLLNNGHAYRCFCSPERLNALAEHRTQEGVAPDYDRTCAHIPKEESDDRASKGEAHVIRLLVPDKYPPFADLVYGIVRSRRDSMLKSPRGTTLGSFDDPILIKSDGYPTYHLANVIDDHLMEITHVIRGSEWLSSTPKHLALYQAFGWRSPQFAHVGLLLDKDRQKLSKRTGSIDVRSYRTSGIFPETLTNFVALLGWSHNVGQDVLSMDELIRNASMKYTRGDSVVGFEKLLFLQKRHAARYASLPSPANPSHNLRMLATKPIVALLEEKLLTEDLPVYSALGSEKSKEDLVHEILLADAQTYKLPPDFIMRNAHFFAVPSLSALQNSIPSLLLHKVPPCISPTIDSKHFVKLLDNITTVDVKDWTLSTSNELRQRVAGVVEQGKLYSMTLMENETGDEDKVIEKRVQGAWSKLVHGYLRWALMAANPGPDAVDIMRILGKSESVGRLQRAQAIILKEPNIESSQEVK